MSHLAQFVALVCLFCLVWFFFSVNGMTMRLNEMEKEAESCGHQDKEIGITQTLRQNEQIAIYINEGEKDRKK